MAERANIFGDKINWLDKIDSTNDELARKIHSGIYLKEGEVLVAKEQTSGKGLSGNFWESAAGQNLTLSIYLTPNFLQADQQFYLNIAIALGVYDFIKSIITKELVKIKWPNDIYINHKKVGGILINHSISGTNIINTIAGVGVNINQKVFISDAPNPISIAGVTEQKYDLDDCLQKLLNFIDLRYQSLFLGNFNQLRSHYIDALFGYFKWLKFKKDSKKILARITGVTELGLLQLESSDLKIFECDLKEIEFLI